MGTGASQPAANRSPTGAAAAAERPQQGSVKRKDSKKKQSGWLTLFGVPRSARSLCSENNVDLTCTFLHIHSFRSFLALVFFLFCHGVFFSFSFFPFLFLFFLLLV